MPLRDGNRGAALPNHNIVLPLRRLSRSGAHSSMSYRKSWQWLVSSGLAIKVHIYQDPDDLLRIPESVSSLTRGLEQLYLLKPRLLHIFEPIMQSIIALTLLCLTQTISALPQKATPTPTPTPHCFSNTTTTSTSAPAASHDKSSTMFGVLSTLLAFCSVVIGIVGVWQYRQRRETCSSTSVLLPTMPVPNTTEPRSSMATETTLVDLPNTTTSTMRNEGPMRPALLRLRSSAVAKNFLTLHRMSTL
ncbi:hypothetical protein BDV96DRAFT_56161 [Lophiotrema nucula]|uniref:Uncharacterized protein n=1 Tax=Lophiotrema nucula TaxID=690887 RepID=A0A6A5ZBK7_9PLEO|nr:hypothetical protein BDV96DRAFT_56161 [Lophiotrema nucula]